MTLPVTRTRMAHALSIVGESGMEGLSYESAVNAISNHTYRSIKMRWTMASSPKFTPKDFRHFMKYAAREGLIDAGSNTGRIANGEYGNETWTVHLTMKGWEFVEENDLPLLHQWGRNIWNNVPTVIISILAALASSWVIYIWGAPN